MQTTPLQIDIEQRLASAEPEVEVLACEQVGTERLRVFIDHPDGVSLALCERVTEHLRDAARDYGAGGVLAGPGAAAEQAGSLPALHRPAGARAPARAARRP